MSNYTLDRIYKQELTTIYIFEFKYLKLVLWGAKQILYIENDISTSTETIVA